MAAPNNLNTMKDETDNMTIDLEEIQDDFGDMVAYYYGA